MCPESVKHGPCTFEYVQDKYIIKKNCYRSVNKNLATLIYMEERYKNQEITKFYKKNWKGPLASKRPF